MFRTKPVWVVLALVSLCGTAMAMFPASSKGGGTALGFPDVCKTPVGPSPKQPISYPIEQGDAKTNATSGEETGTKARSASETPAPPKAGTASPDASKIAPLRLQTLSGEKASANIGQREVVVDGSSLTSTIATFDQTLQHLENSVPRPPSPCSGTVARRYWEDYIEWSETTSEVLAMLRRFEIAMMMKRSSLGSTKVDKALEQTRQLKDRVNQSVDASLSVAARCKP